MVLRKKLTSEKTRRQVGNVDIDWFLNEYSDTAAGGRMLELLRLFQAYEREVIAARAAHRKVEMVCMVDTSSGSTYKKLHKALDQYRFRMVINPAFLPTPNKWPEHSFQIDLARSAGAKLRSNFVSNAKTFREHFKKSKVHWEGGGKAMREEGAASLEASLLTRLPLIFQMGRISWLRQCKFPECSRWFMGKREAQLHCSPKCTKRSYEDTPKFRKERALFMRKLYKKDHFDAKPRPSMRKYAS